jgi:energy-coupling factor transport system substrate-specific component
MDVARMSATLLRRLEPFALLAVPAVLVGCVLLDIQATAGLTILVASLAVALMLASFEASRPLLRQLMPTVVLAAIAAVGRMVLAPLAYVKPVSAVCIVAGAALGSRCGFAAGALAALSSNFFFGQGPWTPWQMYAWGLMGYLAGVLQEAGVLRSRTVVCALGLLSGLLYGAIMNCWHVLGFVRPLAVPTVLAAFVAAIPFDCVHGLSTAGFLLVIWNPWRRSLARVVRKYALG